MVLTMDLTSPSLPTTSAPLASLLLGGSRLRKGGCPPHSPSRAAGLELGDGHGGGWRVSGSCLLPGSCPPSLAVTLKLPPIILHLPLPKGPSRVPSSHAVPVPHGVVSRLGDAHKCYKLAGLSCRHLQRRGKVREREGQACGRVSY